MHPPSQFLFDGLQPRPHAVTSGLPFDLEFTPAGSAADEGEAQEVEGLRFAESAPLAVFRRRATELDQPGLLPRRIAPPCSSASQLLWQSLTPHVRASSVSAPRLPDADQVGTWPVVGPGVSRFPCKERPHMPVSTTGPGRLGSCAVAPIRVAFRQRNDVGTQEEGTFAAQWLACVLPCQRFADALTGSRA